MRLKLNRLTTGQKTKMIDTNQGVFVCNFQSDYNNFFVKTGNTDNSFGLWDVEKDVLLKNIYNINDFTRKSYINTIPESEGVSLLDVLSPDVQFSSITQFNNVAVGLTNLSNKGIRYLRYDNENELKSYMEHPNTIAVYPPSGSIDEDENNLQPIYILSGIDFNFLEETPLEFEFYDYNTGVMYSNSMNMKNMYDPDWNVNTSITSASVLSETSGTMSNNRYYTDIHSDGNHLIYNVYRFKSDYSADSTKNVPVETAHVNDDPYFNEWTAESASLCAWTSTGNVSSYINEYKNDLTMNDNFSLFGSVVLNGTGKIHQTDVLSGTVPYHIIVDVHDRKLSGTIDINGTKISTSGTHVFEYTPSVDEDFYISGDSGSSNAIIKMALATPEYIGFLNMDDTRVENREFDNWNFVEDSAADYYTTPMDWVTDSLDGFVKRDNNEQTVEYRQVIQAGGPDNDGEYVTISNAEKLSSEDKTYAVLLKMPSEFIFDTKHTIIGGAGIREVDNIAFKPYNLEWAGYTAYNPAVVWRGGAMDSAASPPSAEIYNTEGIFTLPENAFDGNWKWLVFRKDLSNNVFKFDMVNVSKTQTPSKPITTSTYTSRVGYSAIGGGALSHPTGVSKLKFSRFYSWNKVLTDEETIKIIELNDVPSGYDVGYRFDEGAGDNIINYGIPKLDKYVGDFDGSDTYVSASTWIAPSAMKTMCCWVNLDTITATQEILNNSSQGNGVELLIYNRRLHYYVMGAGGEKSIGTPYGALGLNKWYHIAGTHNGPSSTMKLYVDGIMIGSTTAPSTIGDDTFTVSGVLVGEWWRHLNSPALTGESRSLNGQVTDVRIFDKQLTDDEIQDLYTGENVSPGNLLLHWDFQDGTGLILDDIVGTNDGIVKNETSVNFWDNDYIPYNSTMVDGNVANYTTSGNFWNTKIPITIPVGGAWMYSSVSGISVIEQDMVFTTSGLYDIQCSVRDYGNGVLNIFDGEIFSYERSVVDSTFKNWEPGGGDLTDWRETYMNLSGAYIEQVPKGVHFYCPASGDARFDASDTINPENIWIKAGHTYKYVVDIDSIDAGKLDVRIASSQRILYTSDTGIHEGEFVAGYNGFPAIYRDTGIKTDIIVSSLQVWDLDVPMPPGTYEDQTKIMSISGNGEYRTTYNRLSSMPNTLTLAISGTHNDIPPDEFNIEAFALTFTPFDSENGYPSWINYDTGVSKLYFDGTNWKFSFTSVADTYTYPNNTDRLPPKEDWPLSDINSYGAPTVTYNSKFELSIGDITINRVNATKLEDTAMAYDYAERIDGVYRYQNIPRHKSNLFSIRIKDSNLNDNYFGQDKETIQKSVNNIIRKIIDQITPIHTQLFNISWTGD